MAVVDVDRCPACGRVVEWRHTLTGTRVPVDGPARWQPGGPAQILNSHGVIVHSAKVVKELGEPGWVLHPCITQGKLNTYRRVDS